MFLRGENDSDWTKIGVEESTGKDLGVECGNV